MSIFSDGAPPGGAAHGFPRQKARRSQVHSFKGGLQAEIDLVETLDALHIVAVEDLKAEAA